MYKLVHTVKFVVFPIEIELTTIWLFSTLKEELNNLEKLSNGWLARKIADHEAEKGRIMEIFEHINEARVQFEVCAASSFSHLSSQISRLCPRVAGDHYQSL
jgi:hypothetical protein